MTNLYLRASRLLRLNEDDNIPVQVGETARVTGLCDVTAAVHTHPRLAALHRVAGAGDAHNWRAHDGGQVEGQLT
jgi:hypothetical protein